MLTTTVAGRTWSFSNAIGRVSVGDDGFHMPWSVVARAEGVFYVLSRGMETLDNRPIDITRISHWTMDQEFIGDFARKEMTWPVSIALDSDGNLYCSEEYENIIAIYNENGERTGQWGETGSAEGQLDGPSGLAFDREDNLLVVDARNNRVQKFTRDGEFLSAFGTAGSDAGQFDEPWGISVDAGGSVYVADWGNSRLQKFSPAGDHLLTFGGPDAIDGGDLDHPADVAIDSDGDVYVTDWGNKRVQIYEPNGSIITALYGDAMEFSNSASVKVRATGGTTQQAYRRVKDLTPLGLFDRPVGIAIDDQDRIIVTDSTRCRLQVYVKERGYMDPQFNL